jgi:hypothetical protein
LDEDFDTHLHEIEERTESALGSLEQDDRWAEALEVYRAAGVEVDALAVPRSSPVYKDARRLRAYLYLREANALRALGCAADAAALGSLELDAAMESGDSLSIARSMLSLGGTCLANGEIERGLKFLTDAKPMFEHHTDAEHRQGLGWWYIVWADIGNAGLADLTPPAVLEAAEAALEILRPLENWPGIRRAHAARAQAYDRMGEADSARVARTAEKMAAEMMKLSPMSD